jgi:preprotein translocase subunit SecG
MENVVLVIHLLLSLSLIGVVLLQRNEGGGLGMGGGNTATGRAPQTALGKVTWGLAIAFIITSIALTIIAAENSVGSSVVDRITDAPAPDAETPVVPDLGEGSLLPPTEGAAEPLVPTGE